jgi:hypothetical protein
LRRFEAFSTVDLLEATPEGATSARRLRNDSMAAPLPCNGRGMNQKRDVKELRDKAAKYRAIVRLTTDETTANRILELTEELESQARDMERGE